MRFIVWAILAFLLYVGIALAGLDFFLGAMFGLAGGALLTVLQFRYLARKAANDR